VGKVRAGAAHSTTLLLPIVEGSNSAMRFSVVSRF
jgi:hypothetical protein